MFYEQTGFCHMFRRRCRIFGCLMLAISTDEELLLGAASSSCLQVMVLFSWRGSDKTKGTGEDDRGSRAAVLARQKRLRRNSKPDVNSIAAVSASISFEIQIDWLTATYCNCNNNSIQFWSDKHITSLILIEFKLVGKMLSRIIWIKTVASFSCCRCAVHQPLSRQRKKASPWLLQPEVSKTPWIFHQ